MQSMCTKIPDWSVAMPFGKRGFPVYISAISLVLVHCSDSLPDYHNREQRCGLETFCTMKTHQTPRCTVQKCTNLNRNGGEIEGRK